MFLKFKWWCKYFITFLKGYVYIVYTRHQIAIKMFKK